MTKISGWIFMAIGAAVALFSRYVQKRGGEGMAIFFWVGIIMIGIGVFKTILWFVFKSKNETKEDLAGKKVKSYKGNILQKLRLNKDLETPDTGDLAREKQQAMKNIQETAIIVCPMCGTKHYSNSNFCHMCGSRLK